MHPRFFILLIAVVVGFSALCAQADLLDGIPLRGYSDVSYIWDQKAAANFFRVEEFTLFLAKPIDKHVSYLTELTFQPSFASLGADLERIYVQYTVTPWFRVTAGRFHTPLGYWNEVYHHGRYLHTPVTRPVMERYEDGGGILPVHTTGIEIRGSGPKGAGTLGYMFDIGNGRGPVKDPPGFFYSYSKAKSVAAEVYYEWDSGLRLGMNTYWSKLPGGVQRDSDGSRFNDGSGNPITGPQGTEWINGLHAVWITPQFEWLTEYELIRHTYVGNTSGNYYNGVTYTTLPGVNTMIHALYTQLGYKAEPFTPFVRYEVLAPNAKDAYLNSWTGQSNPSELPDSALLQSLFSVTHNYSAGVRYELSASTALKFQSDFTISQERRDWRGTANWAFSF